MTRRNLANLLYPYFEYRNLYPPFEYMGYCIHHLNTDWDCIHSTNTEKITPSRLDKP